METGKQTASMEAWQSIPAPGQVKIIIKAAKAVCIASAYGVFHFACEKAWYPSL